MLTLTSNSTTYAQELATRMQDVTAGLSFSEIARRTDTNRETTRRYMVQGKPSAEFLARFCEAFEVSATWLLCERGPRFDARASAPGIETRLRRAGRSFVDGRVRRNA